MALTYEVLQQTGKFQSALEKWNIRPVLKKNWKNFKHNFHLDQRNLRVFKTTNTQDAGFANQVVDKITQNMANMMHSKEQESDEDQKFINQLTNKLQKNQNAFQQLNQQI